jgi:hypothetical protein
MEAVMVLEKEREALIHKIEAAFADGLSVDELAKFLQEMPLVDEYYRHVTPPEFVENALKRLEAYYRGHTWQEMLSVPGIIYAFTDIDYLAETSSNATAYYLPAFMIAVLQQPRDLVYTSWVPSIVGVFSKFSLAQIHLFIEFAEFMVRCYEYEMRETSTKHTEPYMQCFEELGLRALTYLDEMGSVLKRREGLQ